MNYNKVVLNTIYSGKEITIAEKPWEVSFIESCFKIFISAKKLVDEIELSIRIEPAYQDEYELLIDYCIDIPGIHKEYCSGSHFYVNTPQLLDLGGSLFKEWHEAECQGENFAVVQKVDPKELETLLIACCAYTKSPLIHRRNFTQILEIAEKWKIIGLLRAIEFFIMTSESIHKIRKLEYSVEYRMSNLAEQVLRTYDSKMAKLKSLHEYLAEMKETLDDVHPLILEMFEISNTQIVF